ncbi:MULTISPECIES: hypothetical protein, partial [unclassified Caballeronia]|uniref:hypothetical protein n=1 Tax=unclassified Caballeronia TaxID=2646786 RepID=UPI002854B32C
ATQGMSIALGAQNGFDWKGIAASAIASGASAYDGDALGQTKLGKALPSLSLGASALASGMTSTLVRGGSLQRNAGAIAGDTIGAMVIAQMAAKSVAPAKVKTEKLIKNDTTNLPFTPADADSFDATASGLGLTPQQARALMTADNGMSIGGDAYSPYTPDVQAYAVSAPQVTVRELPLFPHADVRLAQTDGGFWRGLSGDQRSVFETPAPLSEKIGAGVRSVIGGVFVDPLVEVGNQYRDLWNTATDVSTDGWRSNFGQALSSGSYGSAALSELGTIAGAAPLLGAAGKGVAWSLPAAGSMVDSYAAKTGLTSYAVENTGVSALGEIGVPVLRSPNPLSPVQEVDAFGNQIFYRTMSPEHFAYLKESGELLPTTETSISPVLSYSSAYEGTTVKFTLAPGTSEQLQEIGIAANPPTAAQLPALSTETRRGWIYTNTQFKVEGGQMTTQLGKGPGIQIFNQNLVKFDLLR